VPLAYRIDGQILEISAEGAVSANDFANLLRVAAEDVRLPTRPALLSDARPVRPVDAEQLELMALLTAAVAGRFAPIHAIVATKPVIHDLARTYAELLAPFDVDCCVFATIPEARSWVLARLQALND
jgi:hypothetical protein